MKINKKAFQLLLVEKQITRYELADILGIDRTYLWRLFKGYRVGMKVFTGFQRAFPDKDVSDYFIWDDNEPIDQ